MAAHAVNALALSLCEALGVAGVPAEVFVCLYCGLGVEALAADVEQLRDVRGRCGPGLVELLRRSKAQVLLLSAGGYDLSMHAAVADTVKGVKKLVETALKAWMLGCLGGKGAVEVSQVSLLAVPHVREADKRSMLGADLSARRGGLTLERQMLRCKAVNDQLSQWREVDWLNPGALLPWGPRPGIFMDFMAMTRSAGNGCWEGGLLSPTGAGASRPYSHGISDPG